MNMHYGYDVLVPVARQFREDKDMESSLFKLYSKNKIHRVEFIDKKLEKLWVEFCEFHKLANDTSIRY